jgi:hypothetical protein
MWAIFVTCITARDSNLAGKLSENKKKREVKKRRRAKRGGNACTKLVNEVD